MNLLLLKTSNVTPKNEFCRQILGHNTSIKFRGNLLSLKKKCNDRYVGIFRKKNVRKCTKKQQKPAMKWNLLEEIFSEFAEWVI